jgi:hypothetical protein
MKNSQKELAQHCLADGMEKKKQDTKSEKSSDQYLSLICDELLTCHSLNLNPRHFSNSATIYFCSCGESRLFVSWCTIGRCE